jgi:hypothetical protein
MHLELGRQPSANVLAFVDGAERILHEVEHSGGRVGDQVVALPPDVLDSFHTYLRQWRKAAERGPEFQWAEDIETDVLEYLVHALYNLTRAAIDRATKRGYFEIADEGREFYNVLVVALLDGLEVEGTEAATAFAEELRSFWPGLEPPASLTPSA